MRRHDLLAPWTWTPVTSVYSDQQEEAVHHRGVEIC